MSINLKSTGAFDQPPYGTVNTHDFLGSPVHDRGAFQLFTSWSMADQAGIGGWANELWEIRSPQVHGDAGYLRSTFTNPRPIVAGIYGMVINRQYEVNQTTPQVDISDSSFSIWLYGSNGQRVRVTAPDFAAGYTALPSGILQQQSNATPNGSGGFTLSPFFWVLPNNGRTSTSVGGVPMWYYVFDSRILFGNSTTFWPQVVRPVFGLWSIQTPPPTMSFTSATDFNFFSLNVVFDSFRNAWVSLGNDVYPSQATQPSQGFPSQFLETAGFLNGGLK